MNLLIPRKSGTTPIATAIVKTLSYNHTRLAWKFRSLPNGIGSRLTVLTSWVLILYLSLFPVNWESRLATRVHPSLPPGWAILSTRRDEFLNTYWARRFLRLDVRAYWYALSGTVSSCPVKGQEEGGFPFFIGGGQLSTEYFGRCWGMATVAHPKGILE